MSTPSLTPIVPRTYDDYAAIPPDRNRWEVIGGEFYTSPAPTPFHQKLVARLTRLLASQLEDPGLASVFPSPIDVILSRTDVVQPDLVVVKQDRLGIITRRGIEGSPDLVIEVLSQNTALQDRTVKRALYAKFGIPELWLVDPDAANVEILALGQGAYTPHVIFARGDTLRSPSFPTFGADVEKLFAPIA